MKRRGSSLIMVVIAVSFLALGVVMALAAAATWNLQVAYRLENSKIALELADSAIQQAVAELMANPAYGRTPVTVTVPGPSESQGTLSFDPQQAVYCVNNVPGDRARGWHGRPIPTGRVHLVAVGTCRGVERRVEAMIYSPRFPRAIASDGPVELRGALVAAVQRFADVADGAGHLQLNNATLQQGDLVSNDSATLREASRVRGSAQALRSVVRLDNSSVEGEILAPYDRAEFPDIHIADYDPKNDRDTLYLSSPAGSRGPSHMTGVTRFDDGDVEVNGDLELDNAFCYVAGNLTVNGNVHGVGALIVSGDTLVGGNLHLSASDNVALLSGGDVRLRGDGQATSFFVGMLYAGRALSADSITVIGTLLARQRAYISHCNVISVQTGLNLWFRRSSVGFARTKHPGVAEAGELGPPVQPDKGFLTGEIFGYGVADVMNGQYGPSKPGALEIEKRDGRYYYQMQWARNNTGLRKIGPSPDKEWFIQEVAKFMTNDERQRNPLQMLVPGASGRWKARFIEKFRAAVQETEDYVAEKQQGESVGNWNLTPNRFLSEGERLRLVYRREL